MARGDAQLKFRVPEELKAALERSAELNGRSLNAEIVHRLQWTLDPKTGKKPASAQLIIDIEESEKLQRKFDELIAKMNSVL